MERSFRTLRVKEVMVDSPVTVNPGDSLQHALTLLEKYNIHELPVVEHGRLIGIVTDGDLKFFTPAYPLLRDQEELRQALRELTVAEAMTVEPVSIDPEATLLDAVKLMYESSIGALLVAEGERLLGILSVSDILRIVIEQHEA
ncbi:MAG TPA: CBS domain-containing protein [Methylomirabilota bacterium]|jgi:acetoin utilization protein AcuB|nr:CBS domain-containing protein [Methylomirabilota bacterium]